MSAPGYTDQLTLNARLEMLWLLRGQPSYSANCSILRASLEERGIILSRDQVRNQATWLAEQGLATTREVGDYVVVTATERGLDVAAGRVVVHGVPRPLP